LGDKKWAKLFSEAVWLHNDKIRQQAELMAKMFEKAVL
jgi:hypothetical protein